MDKMQYYQFNDVVGKIVEAQNKISNLVEALNKIANSRKWDCPGPNSPSGGWEWCVMVAKEALAALNKNNPAKGCQK